MESKNILWTVLLVNLLSAGVGLGYSAVRMPHVKGAIEGYRVGMERTVAKASGEQAGTEGAAPKKSSARSRKAAPRKEGAPPPRREAPERGSKGAPIKATYVGLSAATDFPVSEMPPAELYPFTPDRRTINGDQMEVDFLIKNASGYLWREAKLVLRSPGNQDAPVFSITDWPIDGMALLSYKFPKSELDSRLKNLRVVQVQGDRVESVLADTLSRQRQQIAREYGSEDAALAEISRSAADGAAKAVEDAQAAVAAEAGAVEVKIPSGKSIPDSFKSPLAEEKTDGQKEAVALFREAHSHALSAQQEIFHIVEQVNTKGVDDALADGSDGALAVQNARGALKQFEDAGYKLTLAISRSGDSSLEPIEKTLAEYADWLVTLIESVERQVTPHKSDFKLQQS